MEKLARIACAGLLCTCAFLTACGPSEEKKAQFAEKKRIDCLDKFCEGDAVPKHDSSREVPLKFGGQWFIGPKDYFSSGINGASFEWWDHKPLPDWKAASAVVFVSHRRPRFGGYPPGST